MASTSDSPKKGYKFFRDRAKDGKPFLLDELETASGWSRASMDRSRITTSRHEGTFKIDLRR